MRDLWNFLLVQLAPIALPFAIGATVALLVAPFLYSASRGQAIRRSADGKPRRGQAALWGFLLFLTVPAVVILWASIGGRALVIERGGVLDERLAQRLSVVAAFAVVVLWGAMAWLLRPGGRQNSWRGL